MSGDAGREFARGHQVVHRGEQFFDAGIQVVEIGGDDGAGFAGQSRGECRGRGRVAVDVEQARLAAIQSRGRSSDVRSRRGSCCQRMVRSPDGWSTRM